MNSYQANCCGIQIEISVTKQSVVKIKCCKCQKLIFSFPGAEEKLQTRKVYNKDNVARSGSSAIFLEKYQIIKKISEGTFAKVYLAFDPDLKEQVAIKLLKFKKLKSDSNKSQMSSSFVNYFIREAQILLELNHHNIVKVKGTGNAKGNPFLVMEYIPGPTLNEALDQVNKDLSMPLILIHHLASALEYGYKKYKIIHRDIKPQNIILAKDRNDIPMIVDFGLAKGLGNHYHALTLEGVIAGTPNYMSIECFTQKGVDHRCDIYSLGATLYFMLTKHNPYYNIRNAVDVLHALKSDKLIPITEFHPNVPQHIIDIVTKAMALDKNDRYDNYEMLKRDIEKALASVGGTIREC